MRTRSQTAREAACSAKSARTTLDALPDEVLVLIVSELATPRWTDEGYRERQRALLPLSLVDRRWRRLAQPRLAEQIRFTSPLIRDCSLASAALPRIGASVRYLGYVVNQTPAPAAVSLRDVLKHLPRLVEVRVDSDELDWHALRELAKLPRLVAACLAGVPSVPSTNYPRFARLRELRLSTNVSSRSPVLAWMTPDNLPSLRAVRFVGKTLDLSDLSPLLAQLDYAQVNETDLTAITNSQQPALRTLYATFAAHLEAPEFPIALNNPLPILFMLSLECAMGASQHTSRHLGIYDDDHYSFVHELFQLRPGSLRRDRDRHTIPVVFCRLEELLKANRPLLSLVVPHSLRTFAPNDAAAVAAIERFEARCRDEGVDLIWSTGQREDEIVCRDFEPSLILAPSHAPHTPLLDSPGLLLGRRSVVSFLPDEIVLLIFETLATPQWDREGYGERQRTLNRLALVCRRFHRLAEPLLWRQLRFDNWQGSTLRKVQRLLPEFGQHVRAMKATTNSRTYGDEQISTQQVAEVVRMLPTLTEVRLNVGPNNDGLFKRLAKLTGLRSLALVNFDVDDHVCFDATVAFPHLSELHLRNMMCLHSEGDVNAWLSATTFPVLRALFLSDDDFTVGFRNCSPFVRQLECIESTDPEFTEAQEPWFTEPPVPPILRRVAIRDVACHPKKLSIHTHLRLICGGRVGGSVLHTDSRQRCTPDRLGLGFQEWKSSFDQICDLLGDGHLPKIRSFFIPSKVRDALSGSGPEYSTALDNFLRACATAGIDLRWLAAEAEHELVCRDFWAYSRELAARRSREQQEQHVDTVA